MCILLHVTLNCCSGVPEISGELGGRCASRSATSSANMSSNTRIQYWGVDLLRGVYLSVELYI